MSERRYAAGMPVDDLCRSCKELRAHTVFVVDGDGAILRVVCNHCGSQHNFRGGEERWAKTPEPVDTGPVVVRRGPQGVASATPHAPSVAAGRTHAVPGSPGHGGLGELGRGVVSERERSAPKMSVSGDDDLELLLRRIIREEAGVTAVTPADKWRGGSLVLRPGKPGLQEKVVPIDGLFHKVVMIRNKLRVLEQQVNAMDIPDDQKVKMQSYITGCYGSLTTFNVLFAEEADRFKGAGGDE